MTLHALRTNLSAVTLGSVLGGSGPVWSGFELCARLLGLPRADSNGIYIGTMSRTWLRQYDAEVEKHTGGLP